MKRCLVETSLIACCALAATHAFAQSASKASAEVPEMQTAAASVKVAKPAVAMATITAAGSVIVLADGIVANAALAQIQPPADGFVYER